MTREQILEMVSGWIDSACHPNSTDKRLIIEKASLVRSDPNQPNPSHALFRIHVEVIAGTSQLPLGEPSRIIAPETAAKIQL